MACLLFECCNSLAHENPLGPSNGQSIALTPALPDPVLSTSTSSSTNVSAPRIVVQCSDDYGTGLVLGDCEDAIEHISPETQKVAFANRDDERKPDGAVPLPWRLMGGECIVMRIFCALLLRCVRELAVTNAKLSSSAMLYPADISTWCPGWCDESQPNQGRGYAINPNLWVLSREGWDSI